MRLGIDFGTCFSSAAFMDGETLTHIKDPAALGYSVPSSVFMSPQKQLIVGKAADNQRRRDPTRYRYALKRDLGKSEPLLLGDSAFLPEDLIAHILKKIKRDADTLMANTGRRAFTGAVLTIPATYHQHKQALMLQAAKQAGFIAEEVTLLTEPMAAALYYARQSNMSKEEKLLVYDLGGGTFDTALLQKQGNTFKYLALPSGIERCGGIDFDRAIYADLIVQHPELRELLRADRDDSVAMLARTLVGELCINLKHQLSEAEEVEEPIVIPGLSELIHHRLTRTAFNQMIAPTILETITCCQTMLQSANITWEQVDRLVLVGGSCRIPYVQHLLQQAFKRPLHVAPDLELVVCQGAALYALQNEIYVVSGTPGDAEYSTIGAALQQAKPKSRIVVRPGTYRENVILDREVEILGVGPKEDILIESSTGIGLKMATPQATVRGLTLHHTAIDAPTWRDHGAVVVPQGHLVLEDCIVNTEVHGIAIRGTGSNATLRRCHILAKKNAGIAIVYGGQGTIEDCDISGNIGPGIHIREEGSIARILRCQIHGGKSLGISISSAAQASIEDCEIFGNTSTGIQICDEKSSATIRRSGIYQGNDKGIAIWQNAQASIKDCEIYDNLRAGILVGDAGSSATIQQCQVHDGRSTGISVSGKGHASIEGCDIHHNVGSGIKAKDGRVIIFQSKIHHGIYSGIDIQSKSFAEINTCTICNNAGPGVRVSNAGSKAILNACNIHDGNAVGILVEDEGEGVINNSTSEGNRVDIYVEPGSKMERFDKSLAPSPLLGNDFSNSVNANILPEHGYLHYEGKIVRLQEDRSTFSIGSAHHIIVNDTSKIIGEAIGGFYGKFLSSNENFSHLFAKTSPYNIAIPASDSIKRFLVQITKDGFGRYILNFKDIAATSCKFNNQMVIYNKEFYLKDGDHFQIEQTSFVFRMK